MYDLIRVILNKSLTLIIFRWVREFLNEENLGLDVLIDYLSFRLGMMRHEQRIAESRTSSEEKLGSSADRTLNNTTINLDKSNGYIRAPLDMQDSPSLKRRSKHVAKLNMGHSKDDIHVCIMCMRAIMNNKVSLHFNMFGVMVFKLIILYSMDSIWSSSIAKPSTAYH